MRHPKRITLLALLGACLAAAGCGSDDEGEPIPQQSAAALEQQLDVIQARIEDGSVGACEDVSGSADPNTSGVEDLLNGLPGDVDRDLRDALAQGFDRLFELVDQRCRELSEEAGGTDTPTETTEPAPDPIITETETVPPATDTTPTDTTEEPPPTTTPTEPAPAPEEPPAEDEGGGALAPDGDEG